MPVLTKNDIHAAMYLGLIEIDSAEELNATSLDVSIDKLLTPAMERKDMKEVPVDDEGCWVVGPDKLYLYETVERFKLEPGFHGRINSRSSWARYGVASREADDEFKFPSQNGFEGKVICQLKTLGTTVKIRPGDAIAQAHLAYNRFVPVQDDQLEWLLQNGMLEITRRGKRLKNLMQPYMVDGKMVIGNRKTKGRRMNGGFTLTHDPMIKVYTGKVIDPLNMDPECFYEKRLANQGSRIPAGTFFLSASAEALKIDRHFIGWVHEMDHLLMTSGSKEGYSVHPDERHSTLQTHASAPKIDPFPRFHGKITFENYAMCDVKVKPASTITELYLFHLNNPYYSEKEEASRFKGQDQATRGKAHLDHRLAQLSLPFDKEYLKKK
jgi:deoxycytidine triphosphate deaminase